MDSESLSFIYGTAWKRDRTVELVSQAIQHGFRGFDTAGQPKHYREDLVGEAIRNAFASGVIKNRGDIYIQTKFSRPTAQDPSNAPYSLDAPLEEQVHVSIQSSLKNLRHEEDNVQSSYIDTLLLHSPYPDLSDTLRAWKVFETYVPHRIRSLGVSNLGLERLEEIYNAVDVKPTYVQVRFHPETQFEVGLRRFCVEKSIIFQAHKVIKGNAELLDSQFLADVAAALDISKQTALYSCILGLPAVRIVNGTKTEAHMEEDLKTLQKVSQWQANNQHTWQSFMTKFKELIGDA